MAPVITIAGLKGGISKTCTSIALASYWGANSKVLLVDADVNGSATRWHQRGEHQLPFRCVPLHQAPMAMQRSWDYVVMDTAGGKHDEIRSYAEGSDFVLCPCVPSASSLEQVLDFAEMVQSKCSDINYAVMLSMVDLRRRQDAIRSRQILEANNIPTLKASTTLLSCWPKAEAAGCSVNMARTDGGRPDPKAGRAWDEVVALATEIEERLAVNTNREAA